MRKIIGIGETILDIIFKNGKPIEAVPGGSTFNAILSLGRCGLDVTLISETGDDQIGKSVIDFLKTNGVNADNINVFPKCKTPISLAFLNENNDAEYMFYKDNQHDNLDFTYPEINPDDIVLFGSFYAVNPLIHAQIADFIDYARKKGAIIFYDVNFRPAHKNDVMKVSPNLMENLGNADIVRGSHEDFETLYKKSDPNQVYNAEIAFYCKRFVCTNGEDPIVVFDDNNFRKEYVANQVDIVSTIGAGDNFNAGFIYGLVKTGITHEDIEHGLTEAQWDKLIASAQRFSSESCKDIYNYVSKKFGNMLKTELNK